MTRAVTGSRSARRNAKKGMADLGGYDLTFDVASYARRKASRSGSCTRSCRTDEVREHELDHLVELVDTSGTELRLRDSTAGRA